MAYYVRVQHASTRAGNYPDILGFGRQSPECYVHPSDLRPKSRNVSLPRSFSVLPALYTRRVSY